ncbi:hypothetical protein Tdes44962_MAKER08916 [Teratosphaeria destructans]|uniref:Uncharacterized protein n=1 Tax=Teratosphaeria destructans TaxID=418781 RepID=A0A9W7SV28_9PEZI|nr:hypothetical protein Tdes44962_MAKER08916 [Teratosphaeria destructans]
MALTLTLKHLSKSSSVTSFVGCGGASQQPDSSTYYVSIVTVAHLVPVRGPGIVDDEIEPSELVLGELDDVLPALPRRDIRLDELGLELGRGRQARLLAEVRNDDLGAFSPELLGDAFAEAAGAPVTTATLPWSFPGIGGGGAGGGGGWFCTFGGADGP